MIYGKWGNLEINSFSVKDNVKYMCYVFVVVFVLVKIGKNGYIVEKFVGKVGKEIGEGGIFFLVMKEILGVNNCVYDFFRNWNVEGFYGEFL